jgi:hypothetical protein
MPTRPDCPIGFPQMFPNPYMGSFPGMIGGPRDIFPDLSGTIAFDKPDMRNDSDKILLN